MRLSTAEAGQSVHPHLRDTELRAVALVMQDLCSNTCTPHGDFVCVSLEAPSRRPRWTESEEPNPPLDGSRGNMETCYSIGPLSCSKYSTATFDSARVCCFAVRPSLVKVLLDAFLVSKL